MKLKAANTRKPESESGLTTLRAYKSSREHLADELLKLDAFIHRQVLRFRDMHAGSKHTEFAGLYIPEEEVNGILRRRPKSKGELSASTGETNASDHHIEALRARISKSAENSQKLGVALPLYQLAHLFNLTPFEMDTVIICLAPELNLKYERLYAYLQDDVTKKYPSVNLVLDLLCYSSEEKDDARILFCHQSPLLMYHLVDFTDNTQQKPLLSKCLKLDDRIVNFLIGFNVLDARISSFTALAKPQRDWSAVVVDGQFKERLSQLSKNHFKKQSSNRLIFYLCGPYGSGRKLIAEAFCRDLSLPLMIVDTRDLLNIGANFEKVIRVLFRETVLRPAAIYLEYFDRCISGDQKDLQYQNTIIKAIEEFSLVTFLAGEKPWNPQIDMRKHTFANIEFPVPGYPVRKRLWKMSLDSQHPSPTEINVDNLANKFEFTGGQIRNAVADARNLAIMRCSNGKIAMEDLYRSCCAQSNQKLSEMAQKIIPHYTWEDIVLPVDKYQHLKEVCSYVKYRQKVFHDWGFGKKLSLCKGLNVLFSGPSGTGKTMAAEIIANELRLDLYKIDLSFVVSKYIGETEKNLHRIFKEAETSNAILFFDEADALFGKRSEVKDSHDRYANIEINYLLQKMEEHEGIVILASNFRKNIDEAFTRRMHFSVDFPFPDGEYRLRIWQRIFPKETPTSDDIDFEFLAKRFKISGGSIKNIALCAAFLAAEKSRTVGIEHIIQATKRELQKMGKLCVQSDFGEYHSLIMPEEDKR